VIAGYRDSGNPVPPLSDNAIDAYHLDGTLAWSYFHTNGIAFEVGFTPDGQTLMVGGGWSTSPNYVEGGTDTIQRLDAATGAEVAHFGARRAYSDRVAFSPDNRLFASAGFVMQVWNVADGTVAHTFEHGAGSVEFSRDGTKLLANVGNIGVWSVPDYTLLHVLPGHNNGTTDAVFTTDATMVASGGFDNRVKLRRLDGSVVWNNPVNSPPLTLAASPDGQMIAAGTRGSTIYLWRTSDGALLRTIVGVNVVERVAFSPDSTMLAAAENNYFENLKLYRVSDGALLRSFVDPTFGFQKNDVAFTPDGSMLVFSSGGQYIAMRRIADGALLRLYDEETGTGPYEGCRWRSRRTGGTSGTGATTTWS
jgi:WD40 repeat protein